MTRPIWMGLMMREAGRVHPIIRGIIAWGVTRGIVRRRGNIWVGVWLIAEIILSFQFSLLTLKLIACWWEVVFRVIDSPDVFNKLLSNAWLTGSVVVPVDGGAFGVVECNKFDFSSDTDSDVSRWRLRSRKDRWSGRNISSVINVNGEPGWNASIWVGLCQLCSEPYQTIKIFSDSAQKTFPRERTSTVPGALGLRRHVGWLFQAITFFIGVICALLKMIIVCRRGLTNL